MSLWYKYKPQINVYLILKLLNNYERACTLKVVKYRFNIVIKGDNEKQALERENVAGPIDKLWVPSILQTAVFAMLESSNFTTRALTLVYKPTEKRNSAL